MAGPYHPLTESGHRVLVDFPLCGQPLSPSKHKVGNGLYHRLTGNCQQFGNGFGPWRGQLGESLAKILDEILGVFQAYRDAQGPR